MRKTKKRGDMIPCITCQYAWNCDPILMRCKDEDGVTSCDSYKPMLDDADNLAMCKKLITTFGYKPSDEEIVSLHRQWLHKYMETYGDYIEI